MIDTPDRLDELRQQLVALRTRFSGVGARAAAAAAEVRESVVPAEDLLDDLRSTAGDFNELRRAIVDQLSGFPNTPDPTKLTTLKALDAVLTAMQRVEAEHAQRAGWESARDEALATLDRVATLIHRETPDSAALTECQAQARELHEALASEPFGDIEQLSAHLRPFVELVTLADGWNQLDDDHCAALQESITQTFGRPLALAALRGKLGHQGETVPEPEAPAPPPLMTAPAPAAAAPVVATPPVDDGRIAPPPGSPLVVELRASGERVQVE